MRVKRKPAEIQNLKRYNFSVQGKYLAALIHAVVHTRAGCRSLKYKADLNHVQDQLMQYTPVRVDEFIFPIRRSRDKHPKINGPHTMDPFFKVKKSKKK